MAEQTEKPGDHVLEASNGLTDGREVSQDGGRELTRAIILAPSTEGAVCHDEPGCDQHPFISGDRHAKVGPGEVGTDGDHGQPELGSLESGLDAIAGGCRVQ